jgi:acetyl-CoA synthetase
MSEAEIDALLQEERRFPPSVSFRSKAHVADESMHREAEKDYEAFWARMAGDLDWIAPWSKVLEWNLRAKWFTEAGSTSARTASTDT